MRGDLKKCFFSRDHTYMKILIASDHNLSAINGVVTSIINLKCGLEKQGHEVRILTLSEDRHERNIRNNYYLGAIHVGIIYPGAKFAIPKKHRIIREIIEWKPDIIHSQTEFSVYSSVHYIAKMTGAPIVHTYHTVYENYLHYFPPAKLVGARVIYKYIKYIYNQSAAFIVPTNKMVISLNHYGIDGPINIIPTGIDKDTFSNEPAKYKYEIRRRFGISENDLVLINLGRVAKEKNIEELIDYVNCLDIDNVKLVIVGDGPYLKKLKLKCNNSAHPECFIFTGMVEPEYAPRMYCIGDVFVNASTSETQGLSYMEAMSCGLPVLCRNDSCMDGIVIHGENGFIYNTKEEFLEYAKKLGDDPGLRRAVGELARKTICDKFSVEAFINACESVYESVS